MFSDFKKFFKPFIATGMLTLLTMLNLALSAHAEDPLLGIIKAIKCVGCDAGKVILIVHDPIDVRDFEVSIPDGDYFKIVTPLPGKKVYDRGDGCFYWDEAPKAPRKDTSKAMAKTLGTDADQSTNKNGVKENAISNKSPEPDSAQIAAAIANSAKFKGKKMSKKTLAHLMKLEQVAVADSLKKARENSKSDEGSSDNPSARTAEKPVENTSENSAPDKGDQSLKPSRCIPFTRVESAKPARK